MGSFRSGIIRGTVVPGNTTLKCSLLINKISCVI